VRECLRRCRPDELNGKHINKFSDFKYQGSKVSSTKNDLAHRRSFAWAAFKKLDKIWLAKHVSAKLKVNILRASVFSVLLYGSETWILTNDLETELNSFVLHYQQRILGISLLDHIRNEDIYALPLSETAQYRQLSWVGHALRR
jgi:hypothetical protein